MTAYCFSCGKTITDPSPEKFGWGLIADWWLCETCYQTWGPSDRPVRRYEIIGSTIVVIRGMDKPRVYPHAEKWIPWLLRAAQSAGANITITL